MQVIRESRPRLTAFWALALVSMAIDPSRNPYHMATAWIDPSWLRVHMVIGRRSWRKASISSGVIVIRSRCLTPWPIWLFWAARCVAHRILLLVSGRGLAGALGGSVSAWTDGRCRMGR